MLTLWCPTAFYLQPFFARTLKGGYSVTLSSEISANWKAASDERWTVPVIPSTSKTFAVGTQPMSFAAGARYNVDRPSTAPDWACASSARWCSR